MTVKTSHNTSILAVNDIHSGAVDDPAVKSAKLRFGIIGNAPALAEAVARAIRVAPIDLSVLVTGESGSGKEFFPKIIHQNSPRKHAKYIAVNCGAIPEGTIDSELFGHEKAPLPELWPRARDTSKKPTAARYSSMKWPSCL